MIESKISDLFETQYRFLRSIHLGRDFKDPSVLESYILTEQAQSVLKRIAMGLIPNSGQRAWRVTGDYGSGKSSFALVLAHLFSGKHSNLPTTLENAVDFDQIDIPSPRLLPVLVTGTRMAISNALIQSLYRALVDVYERGREPNILKRIREFLSAEPEGDSTDAKALSLLQEAIDCLVNTDKATGVLVILDELGKFLEFAALHPEKQDIYFLQRLAETAARSGKHPFLVVGLLHQSFHAYADQLSQASQREWEKVSGRFEEILFSQAIDHTVNLAVGALGVKQKLLPTEVIHLATHAMESTYDLGWYEIATPLEYLRERAAALYPLHPTVLPVLVKVFTRFGQNDRSLFSFLLAQEPYGLQDFARQGISSNQFYCLHHLYDYIRATFGYRIGLQGRRNHWHLIESIVNNFHADDDFELNVLKTIAILNLVDDMHLLATKEAVTQAMLPEASNEQRSIEDVLQDLHTRKHNIHYRGAAGGYCLWPHTSVNLEKAYEDACRAIGSQQHISLAIQDYLEKRPMVARRHYITTGTLRYFDVLYVPVAQLLTTLATTNTTGAVGRIIVPLCETQEERLIALQFAQSSVHQESPDTLTAISQPLVDIAGLLQEVQRWQWISENVPELVNDTYAAEEVTRQLISAKQMLERRIHTSLGVQQSIDHMEASWFYHAKPLNIPDRRSLFTQLSDICDELYHQAPRILNELVNRDSLSSAASTARLKLIELILSSASKPLLGLNPASKPPEMSIYLSLCKKTRLHHELSSGWTFALPSPEHDTCNVRPTFLHLQRIWEDHEDNRVSVATIFNELRKPPYGIRDGLAPIFLAIFAIMHMQDLAFYENGSFLRDISGHDFRRLIKAPANFDVQFCRISGPRAELFDAFRTMLDLPLQESFQPNLLDIVRPLFVLAARLPEYTRRTKNLSATALAVREVLLAAREPGPFLFHDLPQACDFAPFEPGIQRSDDATRFIQVLKDALDELKSAYHELRRRLKQALMRAFELPEQQLRETLALRAEAVATKVAEPRLKAFCFRLLDAALPQNEWMEALGSFVCSKIPASWTDLDEHRFEIELNQLCTWFLRMEAILFKENLLGNGNTAIRIAITQSSGKEIDRVLYISSEEEEEIMHVQEEIMRLLMYNRRMGLIAASRAFLDILSQEEGNQE